MFSAAHPIKHSHLQFTCLAYREEKQTERERVKQGNEEKHSQIQTNVQNENVCNFPFIDEKQMRLFKLNFFLLNRYRYHLLSHRWNSFYN